MHKACVRCGESLPLERRNPYCRPCMALNMREFRKQHPEYVAWANMLARCLRPKHPRYADYGGRGIGVCKRWRTFENFIMDMGHRPGHQYSLDRINNDSGYSPSNCRWATTLEQMRNRRARAR